MGGFHQLRVRQKTICKRHSIIGYQKWLVDAGVVAAGCADAVAESQEYENKQGIVLRCGATQSGNINKKISRSEY